MEPSKQLCGKCEAACHLKLVTRDLYVRPGTCANHSAVMQGGLTRGCLLQRLLVPMHDISIP